MEGGEREFCPVIVKVKPDAPPIAKRAHTRQAPPQLRPESEQRELLSTRYGDGSIARRGHRCAPLYVHPLVAPGSRGRQPGE